MDSFTSSILLNIALTQGIDASISVSKMMPKSKGPSEEAIQFFNQNAGKKCVVRGTTHEGIVEKLNTSEHGFYPGCDYPIYVRITSDRAKGSLFEYNLDQVLIVN